MKHLRPFLLLFALAGGCAYVQAVNQVEVYRSTRPARPFRELGVVEGRRGENEQQQPTAQALEFRLKSAAYQKGANAVIDIRDEADPYGNLYLIGTAIQYTDIPPPAAPGYQSAPPQGQTVVTPPPEQTVTTPPPPEQPAGW